VGDSLGCPSEYSDSPLAPPALPPERLLFAD